MISTSTTQRYLAGLTRPAAPAGTPRGRAGYSFWQRYWASLTRYRLPEKPADADSAAATDRVRAAHPGPAVDLSARIPLSQRLPLRRALGDDLREAAEMADHLVDLARALYETTAAPALPAPGGWRGYLATRRARREHAWAVSGQVTEVLVALEQLYQFLSEMGFDELIPAGALAAFTELELTQAYGRAHLAEFVAASTDSATAPEQLQRLASELTAWCIRLHLAFLDIDAVLSDVRGADLREANLNDVDLDGLRWSPQTQWPSDWHERIVAMSVRRGPEEFEIGGEGGNDHEHGDATARR